MAQVKLSDLGQEIFESRYAYPGETKWADRAKVIAKTIASAERDDEKEKIHQEQIEKLREKQILLDDSNEKVEVNGVLIPKKLFTKDRQSRTCPVCNIYSFNPKDDVYMKKFECCHDCYIQWVSGREERWKTGWRPNK